MSSKRAIRRKQCDGKRCYPDKDAAARMARQRSAKASAWILPYRCPFCGNWHIGHPPKRRHSAGRRS